jgi:phenylalanyl-tRNA synthetase beta subunit
MKVAHSKLQEYFAVPLPPIEAIAEAFTFHTWEIDGIEGEVLDIKVLPNRSSDAKTELGIARQLSAILNQPLKSEYEQVELGTMQVRTSLSQINGTLGLDLSAEEVEDVFRRLRFGVAKEGTVYVITAPKDRTDLTIPVDIAEEVGQIVGYDRVPELELPSAKAPADQARYHGIERIKDELVAAGYTEVSTQSFATNGDVELANPLDKTMPFLRTNLEVNLMKALELAKKYAALLYSPKEKPKLFEVGTVFPKMGEYLELRVLPGDGSVKEGNLDQMQLEDYGKGYQPIRYELGHYKSFSVYPFITRDIAFWTSLETEAGAIEQLIRENAGDLLVRLHQFDRFEKEGRVSYGFRLVFQASGRTLTDDEVAAVMTTVSTALEAKGFEIR